MEKERGPNVLRRAGAKLAELFSIDLRSLAVFRMALGVLLLADLAGRVRFLDIGYTDAGVLPRAILPPLPRYSLHALDGGIALQVALFSVAAAFAAMLLAGVFTRIATLGSWLLLISLHYRSPFLLDGGDVLLRQLLLWSLFLPLGERWSVDAWRRRAAPTRTAVLSAASIALLLQFVFFYVSTGVAKTGPEWTERHTALQMALSQTYWSLPFGQSLRQHPALLAALTPAVLAIERYAPFLMFAPWLSAPIRLLTILGFAALMIGLGLTIHLNLFPFVGMLVVLPFLPTWLWERGRRAATTNVPRYRTRWTEWTAALVVIPLIVYAGYLNLLAHGKARPWMPALRLGERLGIHQNWMMYAPSPPPYDLDFVVTGILRDGSRPTLLDTATGESWERLRAPHADYRFKYHVERLLRPDDAGQGPDARTKAYLEWVCREWNATHAEGEHLETVVLGFRPTNIEPEPTIEFPEQLVLGELRCE